MKIVLLLFLAFSVVCVRAQQASGCDAVEKKLSRAETRLNDWAELMRYRDANANVLPPKPRENRVVFLGDSITDLWDDSGFGGFFPGKPYLDRGISGQTTTQMLVRFRQDVIRTRPKVVVILAGTNDIAGNTGPMTLSQTADNIESMAELARANRIKVVLSSVLPVSDTVRRANGGYYIQTTSRPPAKIVEMNRWIRQFAKNRGYTYLDYYAAMVDGLGFIRDGLTFDGLHPNAKGYAVMAPLAEKAVSTALKSPLTPVNRRFTRSR